MAAPRTPATVTINVQVALLAKSDGPATGSDPGDPYHTGLDQSITGPTAYTVLTNDTGRDALSVVSYGLNGNEAVPTNSTPTLQGGSVTLNPAGKLINYTPPAKFVGVDNFKYTMTSSIGGSATADVSIRVGVASATAFQRNWSTQGAQESSNITIQDAQVVEPSSGSVNMIFTVALGGPAPVSGTTVNFTTQNQPPASGHATSSQDYMATSGTVSFAQGEQFKTISVPVLSDGDNSEIDETFLVVLSNPVNGLIGDDTATGTIQVSNQQGSILITELRTSGPGGVADDFVEIYNNSDAPHTVTATDGSGGYGLFMTGADCNVAPVLIAVIPNGTVIPARGHYLFVGSGYSLSNYGGTGAAAGDQTLPEDLESDRNIALFSTAALINVSSANRLDAVGFGNNTVGNCDLLREGPTLLPLVGATIEYSYVRDECGKRANLLILGPCPLSTPVKDSNNNVDDFFDTSGLGLQTGVKIGSPGPQNLGSPTLHNSKIQALLLDSNLGAAVGPNRVRDETAEPPLATDGTLSIRRRFVNNTGAPVTRLRFRVIDITAGPAGGNFADVRGLTSTDVVVSGITDESTCLAHNGVPTTPCSVTVLGTILEQPPFLSGGGFNSSLSVGSITLATPLPAGASVSLQFLLGVRDRGVFKFYVNIEALTGPLATPLTPSKPEKGKVRIAM